MADTSVTKVDAAYSPVGAMGQRYLAAGARMGMRLWKDEAPTAGGVPAEASRRDYEVVGFVLSGRAQLEIEGQLVELGPGNSYVVPRGAVHRYTILERFTAVETTAPPSFLDGRDEVNLPPRHLCAEPAPSPPEAPPLREVLVGVDLTERCAKVIEQAVALARPLSAVVRLVHVCTPPMMLGTPTGELLPCVDIETLERAANEELSALATRYSEHGVTMAHLVKAGDVAESLVELSAQVNAGLLVLGTHGRHGIAHALLGSTAEKVVRSAQCPVLTMHA